MARSREARIFEHYRVDLSTGCWGWTGSRDSHGYGRLAIKGKRWRVHRLAAVLWLGFNDDPDLKVCHRCDNPPCFNPAHLFIGTALDNMRDKCQKGRQANDRRLYSTAKLTDEQIREIRVLGARVSHRELGQRYGVSHETIRLAYLRKTFKLVPD